VTDSVQAPSPSDSPVWAREDAFPVSPAGWGWVDPKGGTHPCADKDALAAAIRDDRDGSVTLVWTPGHERMILPEELPGMVEALRTAREHWTRDDLGEAYYRLRWFGGIFGALVLYYLYRGYFIAAQLAAQGGTTLDSAQRLKFSAGLVIRSTQCGLALLMFVIFAFIPWWQARKRRRELGKWNEESIAEAAPVIRFETWLEQQKAPFTKILAALVLIVAIAQLGGQVKTAGLKSLFSAFATWDGAKAAGLVKDAYLHHGEWWRLFTAPFLHGNVVHLLMNGAALLYLGKRVEVFARWPHVPFVFLFAAAVGGETSVRFMGTDSVGASGGLMGWLGFLMVFETLHKALVPRRSRRRLAAGVVLTALIGLVGYRYIDNAAHAGGLVAGMLYAVIVFPASSSPHRPRTTGTDKVAGGVAMAALAAAALFAVWKIAATA